jgi:hypothetical protein
MMAGRQSNGDVKGRAFDMRSLLRLGLWGTAATAALALTVLTAYSTTGSHRLQVALSGPTNEGPSALPAVQTAGRAGEFERDTQRLSETVRALAADRDRLITRLATLERSLEDITGAIKRQPPAASPEYPAAPADASPSGAAGSTMPIAESPPHAGQPNPGASGPQAVLVAPPSSRVANAPAIDPVADAEPTKAGPELGVDVGGATSFDALRVLWNSIKRANSAAFEGLNPLVVVRESKSRGADLRLIAGPIANQEIATRLCATLTAARRFCQPAPYEGQQFTLAAPAPAEPERRPVAAPKPAVPQLRPLVRTNP